MIFGLRLLLGIGESVSYPLLPHSRQRISGASPRLRHALIDAGSKVGPAMGILVGGLAGSRIWMAYLFSYSAVDVCYG